MNAGTVMQLVASGLFGLAVMLLFVAAMSLVQRQKAGSRSGTLTSMRRAEMRQSAMEGSPVFRATIPFISSLAASVNSLGLDPIRQYVHEPYVRAGYPGGMDDDEVVATGLLLSAAFTLALAFITTGLFGLAFTFLALVGIPLGFVAVVAHLKAKADERQVEILRSLP